MSTKSKRKKKSIETRSILEDLDLDDLTAKSAFCSVPGSVKRGARKVLLLNASEEMIRLVTWQKAVTLLFSDKVSAPYNFDHVYEIQISHDQKFHIPSAIILNEYVTIPYRPIRPTRMNIYFRDSMICQYTGEKLSWADATIDHVIPTSRGGKNTWTNMVVCHNRINSKKSDRTPDEAGLKLIRAPKCPNHRDIIVGSLTDEQKNAWGRWI